MRKLIWNFIICLSLVSLKTFAGDIYKDKCEMLHFQLREGQPGRDIEAAVRAVCQDSKVGDPACVSACSKCVPMAYAEAAAISYPREVSLLEAYHFNIGEKNEKGQTALDTAVDGCHPAEVLNLRLFGADQAKPNFKKLIELTEKNQAYFKDLKNSPYPAWKGYDENHKPKTTPERISFLNKTIAECERTRWVLNLQPKDLNSFAEDIKQGNLDEVHKILIKQGFDDNCKTEILRSLRRDVRDLKGEPESQPAPISDAERKHCQDPKIMAEADLEKRIFTTRSEVDTLIITMYRLNETHGGIFKSDATTPTSVQTGQ